MNVIFFPKKKARNPLHRALAKDFVKFSNLRRADLFFYFLFFQCSMIGMRYKYSIFKLTQSHHWKKSKFILITDHLPMSYSSRVFGGCFFLVQYLSNGIFFDTCRVGGVSAKIRHNEVTCLLLLTSSRQKSLLGKQCKVNRLQNSQE